MLLVGTGVFVGVVLASECCGFFFPVQEERERYHGRREEYRLDGNDMSGQKLTWLAPGLIGGIGPC